WPFCIIEYLAFGCTKTLSRPESGRGPCNARRSRRRRAAARRSRSTCLQPQMTIGGMPAWSGLPPETQAALTGLMTRLILEHADKNRTGSIAEVGHDL